MMSDDVCVADSACFQTVGHTCTVPYRGSDTHTRYQQKATAVHRTLKETAEHYGRHNGSDRRIHDTRKSGLGIMNLGNTSVLYFASGTKLREGDAFEMQSCDMTPRRQPLQRVVRMPEPRHDCEATR